MHGLIFIEIVRGPFNLYLSDSCQQNIQKIVTWGIKLQKSKACFVHISMGLLFSGVRP